MEDMQTAARYLRNQPLISEEQQKSLASCTAAVVGLGGLGGYISEQMARLGFGNLILIDNDVVDVTNLNRQIFATEATLGTPKTEAALQRLRTVNASIKYTVHNGMIDSSNAMELLAGADIIMDALDNGESRLVLQEAASALKIPLVHGAVGGFLGQVSFILPGDDIMRSLYPGRHVKNAPPLSAMPTFMPALVASVQVSQAVKWRLKMDGLLSGSVLFIDLLSMNFHVIPFAKN